MIKRFSDMCKREGATTYLLALLRRDPTGICGPSDLVLEETIEVCDTCLPNLTNHEKCSIELA